MKSLNEDLKTGQFKQIYPTRGLQLMKLATNILDGKKYNKENILTSTIVDRNNVDILLSQNTMKQLLFVYTRKYD